MKDFYDVQANVVITTDEEFLVKLQQYKKDLNIASESKIIVLFAQLYSKLIDDGFITVTADTENINANFNLSAILESAEREDVILKNKSAES